MRSLKPLIWALAVLAFLVGAYAWAGYWLAPRLIQSKLPPAIATATGQHLALGTVVVKPFQLSVDVADIVLTEPDGTPLLGAKRLFVDAQLASIWRGGVVLRAVELDEPAVNIVLRPDGSLNLTTALSSKTLRSSAQDEPQSKPFLVSIADIRVNGGVIDAADLRRARAIHERLAPINVRVQNFTTLAGGEGSFHIVGRGQRGASLTLDGHVAVQPFVLDGELTLQELAAQTAWQLAGEYDRIAPPAGVIDVKTRYRIASTPDGVRINLDSLGVDARDLALRASGADSDWIKVAALTASGASVDVHDSLVRLPDIQVKGLDLRAWSSADGKINLAALAPLSADAPAAPAQGRRKNWRIEAPHLRLSDSRVEFEDRKTPAPVRYLLAPLELDVDGYTTDAATVRVALRSGFNDSGRIEVAGDWRLDNPGGDFEIDAQRLPVPFIQPYLERATDLVLRSGAISAKGKLSVALPTGSGAKFGFTGGTTLTNFHSVDRDLQEDFIRFGSLTLGGIDYRSSPASLRIGDVLARNAYFRFVIAPDQSTNIGDVLSPPRLRKGGGPAAAVLPTEATSPAPAPAGRAMKMRIDRVRLVDSSTNFADLSIRPNFATGIEQLEGTLSGLSSDPATRAVVELDGKIDRYAPVEIRGEVNLLAASLYTNLSASFSNIELPTFTPYSGKFMGYKIGKGKLNAKFEYLVENRKLDAKHHFLLDQFTLGDKVESEDAIRLPVKLAIALLKDRNGVIDIDLPVSGSLDDPQFRVAPLVWKVLRNLLLKIVTAPFALLGSLFGAGEEVRFVDFAFGSAALDATARERLANVGKALVDRPQLKLEVPLVTDPQQDRAVLIDQRFDALLGGAATRALRASDPAAYQKVLDDAWRETTGEKRAPRPERDKDEDKDAWIIRCIDAGETALRSHITVADTDLAELAKQRADSVRDALIATTGLDPTRVFVVTGAPEEGATNGVRLGLKVE
ncbi:MAG TPA: DUF748 domain-containing protein [Steroidobacteraceae bacterium]|nr:DUF748 domain-containing protein [Steroidobacteraceae bacterium]